MSGVLAQAQGRAAQGSSCEWGAGEAGGLVGLGGQGSPVNVWSRWSSCAASSLPKGTGVLFSLVVWVCGWVRQQCQHYCRPPPPPPPPHLRFHSVLQTRPASCQSPRPKSCRTSTSLARERDQCSYSLPCPSPAPPLSLPRHAPLPGSLANTSKVGEGGTVPRVGHEVDENTTRGIDQLAPLRVQQCHQQLAHCQPGKGTLSHTHTHTRTHAHTHTHTHRPWEHAWCHNLATKPLSSVVIHTWQSTVQSSSHRKYMYTHATCMSSFPHHPPPPLHPSWCSTLPPPPCSLHPSWCSLLHPPPFMVVSPPPSTLLLLPLPLPTGIAQH